MNGVLFVSMLKMNGKSIVSYGIGMAAYMLLVVWVYPSMASSPALNSLLHSLPEGMLKLIGYQSGVSQVGDFLAGEFYGLIYVIILAIYTVMTSTKLMAHLVENGSMAYLLASPISRTKVAVTQAVHLIVGVLVIGCLCTVAAFLGVHWFVHGGGLDVPHFIEMNVVGMMLFLVIGGYCFLFSCLGRDERTAMSMSAGLTIIFYALNMVGTLTDKVGWMKNLSIFTTFDAQTLIHGHGHFASTSLLLAIAALVLYGIAIAGFRHRQMSL